MLIEMVCLQPSQKPSSLMVCAGNDSSGTHTTGAERKSGRKYTRGLTSGASFSVIGGGRPPRSLRAPSTLRQAHRDRINTYGGTVLAVSIYSYVY